MKYMHLVTSITLLLLKNAVFSPSALAVSSHWFRGRERVKYDWLPFLFSPLLLLWVTHSVYWCNTNIVATASGFPPTQLQYNLIPSPLFVLTLPHWFPSFLCLCSTCSHLRLYLDNDLILCASLFLFCLHTSFCFFLITTCLLPHHLSCRSADLYSSEPYTRGS